MFVTRAGRHDRVDLQEFVSAQRGEAVDTARGTAMIAREGAIVGCVRIIEVEPNLLVYDDLLVAGGRDESVAKQLVQAAMNNKGGTIFAAVPSDRVALLEEFGFTALEAAGAPELVRAYWGESGRLDGPGLAHLSAR
ncbi:MAG: hypothetical protein ACRDJ2_16475 [Actinomycetota bacterium]